MHSGNMCIELTEAGTWESFEAFAQNWIAQIGADGSKLGMTIDLL